MPYLDKYTTPLTAKTAAHLLRRATFGPTQQEITGFTGITATEAVARLINNKSYTLSEPPPIDIAPNSPNYGQPITNIPFNNPRSGELGTFIGHWWVGIMAKQNGFPSVLEKLAFFWQNHFVVSMIGMADYRFLFDYVQLLRNNCLGNFRTLTIAITKNPGMLIYQNGNENVKGFPNENYARELQELFTVGVRDFAGNLNYTEDDVKEAARVLTGWQAINYYASESTTIGTKYTPDRHDSLDKVFSAKYLNKRIVGRSGPDGGETELKELVDMLLNHPECPKHICRKLYRWYVNTNITQEIETNVIVPLAQFFSSSSNNFEIQPVLEKLLTSQIFFDSSNIGSLIKAPTEYMIGMARIFSLPVPDMMNETAAWSNYVSYFMWGMAGMQLFMFNQPLVFGYPPYYQTGYSKNWINAATITMRRAQLNSIVYPNITLQPGKLLGVDIVKWLESMQPSFSDLSVAPITPVQVLNGFTKNLFAIDFTEAQKNFLIDTVFMGSLPRFEWNYEWNAYRKAPTDINAKNAVLNRGTELLKYLLRMAEYEVF